MNADSPYVLFVYEMFKTTLESEYRLLIVNHSIWCLILLRSRFCAYGGDLFI